MKQPRIYLPGLNGLRAIAAIVVVLHHLTGGLGRYQIVPPIFLSVFKETAAGYGAVVIFFVISGFLITYLLLKEKQQTGNIDIKKFYIRRILRIWPLYFLYLLVVIFLAVALGYTYSYHFFWYYFIFAGNVVVSMGGYSAFLITHYWSLAAEEQFYLFWPVFSKKFNARITPALIILISLFSVAGLLQSGGVVHSVLLDIFATFRFMLIGCLGAVYYFNGKKFLQLCFNKIVQIVTIVVMALIITSQLQFNYLQYDIVALLALVLIIALINGKSYFLHFENKVCNYLGKISYGIYVIHPLVIWLYSTRILKNSAMPKQYLIWVVYLSVVGTTILIAGLSYKFFELPFLNMKKKFTMVPSSGTPGD